MTTFDNHWIEVGILTSPEHFEAASAWEPFRPLARESLTLEIGWSRHYLPVFGIDAIAGYDHVLHARLQGMSRRGTPDDDGILVADAVDPSGYLALGPFDSLLRLLFSVEEKEFAVITPAEFCTSLFVEEGDDLSWMNEPPGESDHGRIRAQLGRLAGAVALLDRCRAWALRVGKYHEEWCGDSPLAGTKDRGAFRRRPGERCPCCRKPYDPGGEDFFGVASDDCEECERESIEDELDSD